MRNLPARLCCIGEAGAGLMQYFMQKSVSFAELITLRHDSFVSYWEKETFYTSYSIRFT